MTTGLDAPHSPSTTPVRARRRGRRWLTALAAVGGFAAGLGAGVALPADTTDLEAANAQVQSASDTIEDLSSELAAAEDRAAALAESLAAAQDRVASAEEETEATMHQLEARGAILDKRAKALQRREKAVSAREDALDVPASTPESGDPSSGDFDRAYALDITNDIIEDVRSVDERLRDGGLVSSALSLLSDSYGRLLDAGYPPGINQAEYYAELTTLQSFAEEAADTYYDDPIEASARYAVVRQQTGGLFSDLNQALGTNLRLP